MNILIVEDDQFALNLLRHSLESLGHKVEGTLNAEEAISMAAGGKFDLLISDIMMPGISGLSLVTILRTVHLCTTPIIIMSALHNKPLLESVYDAGANDFLAKPFSIEELEEKIKKYDPKKDKAA
jgi:DNA-binding response OmpR family regulator